MQLAAIHLKLSRQLIKYSEYLVKYLK